MPIFIEIGGKPVAKGRGRIGKVAGHATIFTPQATRSYENLIKMAATQVMAGRPPISEAVEVWVQAYVPIPKSFSKGKIRKLKTGTIFPITKPDADNYLKSALDGINNIVLVDDNQVYAAHIRKIYSDRPRLTIIVEPVPAEARTWAELD